jgi:hypothetical protein
MEKILWFPKIRQAKIWQLYQNDALGAVNENACGRCWINPVAALSEHMVGDTT